MEAGDGETREAGAGPAAESLIGTVIDGRYELLSIVAGDDVSVSYRARHRLMDKPVILKMLRPDRSPSREAVDRFHRETRARQPHRQDVSDQGVSTGGHPYVVYSAAAATEPGSQAAAGAAGGKTAAGKAAAGKAAAGKSRQRALILLVVLAAAAIGCLWTPLGRLQLERGKLMLYQCWYGPQDKRVAEQMERTARACVEQRDLQAAAELLRQRAALLRDATSAGSLDYARALVDLGDVDSASPQELRKDQAAFLACFYELKQSFQQRAGRGDAGAAIAIGVLRARLAELARPRPLDWGNALLDLGNLYSDQGRMPNAESTLQEALKIAEGSDNLDLRLHAVLSMVELYRRTRRLAAAEAFLRRDLQSMTAGSADWPPHACQEMIRLGMIYWEDDQPARARRCMQDVSDRVQSCGDLADEAQLRLCLILYEAGKTAQSLELLSKMVSRFQLLEGPRRLFIANSMAGVARDSVHRAEQAGKVGDLVFSEKLDLAAIALAGGDQLKAPEFLAQCYFSLGDTCMRQNAHARAVEYLRRFLAQDPVPVRDPHMHNVALLYLGLALARQGKVAEANATVEEVLRSFATGVGWTEPPFDFLTQMAQAYRDNGHHAEAEALMSRVNGLQAGTRRGAGEHGSG